MAESPKGVIVQGVIYEEHNFVRGPRRITELRPKEGASRSLFVAFEPLENRDKPITLTLVLDASDVEGAFGQYTEALSAAMKKLNEEEADKK